MEFIPKLSITSDVSVSGINDFVPRKSSYLNRKSSVYLRRASSIFNQVRRESIVIVYTFWQSFRGIILSIMAALLFSIADVMVKSLTNINPSLIALFRFGGMGIFSLAAITEINTENKSMPKSGWIWAIIRGFNGAISLYLYYIALHLLPLTNVSIF